MLKKLVSFAVASLLFLAAAQAQAALLTWRLEDVNFDNGGTAIGFFRYDPTAAPCSRPLDCTGVVPDFDITTTPGFGFPNEYRPLAAGGRAFIVFAGPTGIGIGGDAGFGGTQLNLLFDESLPPDGGIVRLASGSNESFREPDISAQRQIISGSVTTIPEPGRSAFVALGVPLDALAKADSSRIRVKRRRSWTLVSRDVVYESWFSHGRSCVEKTDQRRAGFTPCGGIQFVCGTHR